VRGAVRERSTRSGLPWRSQAQHSLGGLAGGGVSVGRQRCSCSGHAAVAPRPPLAPRASRSMLRRCAASVGCRACGAVTGPLRARRSGGSWRRCCRAAACGRRTPRCCTPRSSTRRRTPCAPGRARAGARRPAAAPRCPAAAPGLLQRPWGCAGWPQRPRWAWPAAGSVRALCTGTAQS